MYYGGKMKNSKAVFITQTALFTALIVVCSWISIPATVSFTLQTFAVCFVSAIGGFKSGALSVLTYILLGIVGVPVFSNFKGGASAIAGPTGGYIVGFIFTAVIVGLVADKFGRKFWVSVISMVLGVVVCYIFGTAWFYILTNNINQQAMSIGAVLGVCVVPFLPFDALKIALAAWLANVVGKRIKKDVKS